MEKVPDAPWLKEAEREGGFGDDEISMEEAIDSTPERQRMAEMLVALDFAYGALERKREKS